MQTNRSDRFRQSAKQGRAFTVLELLVAVSILTVIVYSLYQMFYQTQKAMRGNATQVDVLEAGRAAMDIMSRELEQMSACQYPLATNVYAGLIPTTIPLVQYDLDERTPLRTNVLQEFFFLAPQTNKWIGTGYRVVGATNGVGTLYRFSVATNVHRLSSTNLSVPFVTAVLLDRQTGMVSTNFHRLAEGIIHLRLTAYDQDGRRLGYETTNGLTHYRILRQPAREQALPPMLTDNVVLRQEVAGQTKMIFLSDALPAYLDLEMGVLEPETYEQFKSLPSSTAPEFLKKRASKVHLFRQRIPIRSAAQ